MQILSVLRYRLPGMPSSRTITSVLALAGFTVLAAGSSPELAEEIAEMSDELNEPTDEWDEWPEPVEVPPNGAPISADNFSLADLQGSQIWVIDGSQSHCDKLAALGLVVECDPTWGSGNSEQIVIRCTQIPHIAAPMLLEYLGLTHFTVDTYVTDPSTADDSECGEIYEIAIWLGEGY